LFQYSTMSVIYEANNPAYYTCRRPDELNNNSDQLVYLMHHGNFWHYSYAGIFDAFQDDTAMFEKQSALFALAISDIVLINMWVEFV
jgi:hypothetical protein